MSDSKEDFELLRSVARGEIKQTPQENKKRFSGWFGEWQLIDPLSEGGYGCVYRAEKYTGAIAAPIEGALKITLVDKLKKHSVAIYENEVAVLSQIKSKYIAQLLGHGIRENLPWIVSEYVAGPSLLAKMMREKKYSQFDWLKLAHNIFKALNEVHLRSIAHRDFHPRNILYSTADDLYVLIDFGLALFEDNFMGQSFGTANKLSFLKGDEGILLFQSPEQTQCQPTISSDVFSAGVILYQAATGNNPWFELCGLEIDNDINTYDKAQILDLIRHQEPTYEGLSEDQTTFLKALLDKDEWSRPATFDILEAITDWMKSGSLSPEFNQMEMVLSAPMNFDMLDNMIHEMAEPPETPGPYEAIESFFDELPASDFNLVIAIQEFGELGIYVKYEDGKYLVDFKLKGRGLDVSELQAIEQMFANREVSIGNYRYDLVLNKAEGSVLGERIAEFLRNRFGEYPPEIRIY
jgi:serine/threonine protein kinase